MITSACPNVPFCTRISSVPRADSVRCNQLKNAVAHSATLGGGDSLDSLYVDVGCGTRLVGENVEHAPRDSDPALKCVSAWVRSSAHRNLLLSTEFDTASVGIVHGPANRVTCTQT